jgi:hypothetical protein
MGDGFGAGCSGPSKTDDDVQTWSHLYRRFFCGGPERRPASR